MRIKIGNVIYYENSGYNIIYDNRLVKSGLLHGLHDLLDIADEYKNDQTLPSTSMHRS